MGKSLVIVESPAKAKTINKYLGSQYVVKSSIGHIRDLPTSGSVASKEPVRRGRKAATSDELSPKEKSKRQLIARMGVNPEQDWVAQYEILPGKEKVVEELRRLAQEADTIYLATDLDREGEAIAWHLREAIGGDNERYKRVVFNEITQKAIKEAFSHPGDLDLNRVNAQQARRFLDRVVGYMVSPLLWQKIARGLSAGRVQSVAVRLVVEREREIRAFIPEEYWELHADLATLDDSAKVRFAVVREQGKAFEPKTEAEIQRALALLDTAQYQVVKREDKPTTSKPSAPFITSTLQQAASTRLGFGVKKTMMMAQRLYEAGYITYMRTDSTNLSEDALVMVRDFIEGEFGERYLPKQSNLYSSKEGAQEAHEAIRPSDVRVQPGQLSGLERDAERLYELIWRQFVACQMTAAEYLSTQILVNAADFELRARGRILKFDGYTRVLPALSKTGEDDVLPDMQQGNELKLLKLDPSQHFTKPPARYSEASLVKEMEKRGIGRPSTYASIISTIQDRGYVSLHNRRFYAEKMGEIVTERLSESFTSLMDYGFTAGMEENLDAVAQGHKDWKHLLDTFYQDFRHKLEQAETAEGGMRANQPTPTNIPCKLCGRPMMIRTASTGVFLGCSGYSLPPKERCKGTVNLVPGGEIAEDDEGESESRLLREKRRCPICSDAMEPYLLDEHHKLHICGNNPDCPGYELEEGQYRIKGYEGPSLECDKCGSEMQLKTGRFGKFFGCTNSECKNTRKLLKSGEPAPPKMDVIPMPELRCDKVDDTYVLRDGAAGLFLAASQFPKNRETRAPLVKELLPHASELDPKYHYLLEAPAQDPQGRAAIVRFSRKTKEHYVQSEQEGKPTGWRAVYDQGRWQITDKSK